MEHMASVDGIADWGFPTLYTFLASFPTYEYRGAKSDITVIIDWLRDAVKETLSQYARVVDSPDLLTESDVEKTYEIADRVARTVRLRMLLAPPVFDEMPIVEVLEQLMVRYPHLKPKILPIIQEKLATVEEVEEKYVEKAEAIAQEVIEALKEREVLKETERPSDVELIEEIKKRILRRLGEL